MCADSVLDKEHCADSVLDKQKLTKLNTDLL